MKSLIFALALSLTANAFAVEEGIPNDRAIAETFQKLSQELTHRREARYQKAKEAHRAERLRVINENLARNGALGPIIESGFTINLGDEVWMIRTPEYLCRYGFMKEKNIYVDCEKLTP